MKDFFPDFQFYENLGNGRTFAKITSFNKAT